MNKLLEMFDASRRSADQELLRNQKLAEIYCIKSPAEVLIQRCVGAGGEGKVYEGKFNKQKVAVKIIKSKTGKPLSRFATEGIENELMLMQAAAGQCVLKVWGFVHDTFETLIVLELALGSLDAVLDDTGSFPAIPLSLTVAWLMDVASAVEHLHEKRIRHRDIKAQNMLLFKATGSRLVCKIGDFGLAKATLTAGTSAGGAAGAGTEVFCAPEYMLGERFTFACDVYSVGMTGVQLLSRRTPRRVPPPPPPQPTPPPV